MMENVFEALIFDLDGTLVDSASIIDRVMMEWCSQNDIEFSVLKSSVHSSRTEDTIRNIAPNLDARREAKKIEIMERDSLVELREIPGASSMLQMIPDGRWAIATSSDGATARAKLAAAKLPHPSVLIGADNVSSGKPNPEAYLLAAKSLGYDTSACLAFEDSDTGVRSAIAAGCRVVIVGSDCKTSHEMIYATIEDFAELSLVFPNASSIKVQIQYT